MVACGTRKGTPILREYGEYIFLFVCLPHGTWIKFISRLKYFKD